MIKRVRLLQEKYSLSDEYIVEFIKNEIHRQAIQDLEGALKNASITKLEEIANTLGKPSQEPQNVANAELSGSIAGSTGTSEDDVPSSVQPGRNRNKAKHKSKRT